MHVNCSEVRKILTRGKVWKTVGILHNKGKVTFGPELGDLGQEEPQLLASAFGTAALAAQGGLWGLSSEGLPRAWDGP